MSGKQIGEEILRYFKYCPICGKESSIRLNLTVNPFSKDTATCLNCGATWHIHYGFTFDWARLQKSSIDGSGGELFGKKFHPGFWARMGLQSHAEQLEKREDSSLDARSDELAKPTQKEYKTSTLETSARIYLLYSFLVGVCGYMIFHLFSTLYSNSGSIDGLLILDVAIRDMLPLSMVLGGYVLSDRIISRRHELVPLSEYSPDTKAIVNEMASKIGVEEPESYISVADGLDAFTFGSNDNPKLVLASGILGTLEGRENQLRSVVLHELGHVKNRDVAIMTWGEVFCRFLKIWLPILFCYEIFYGVFFGGTVEALVLRLFFVSVFLLIVPYALINSISREREILADRYAVVLSGSPEPLQKFLVKADIIGKQRGVPSRLVMTKASFLRYGSKSLFTLISSTHPTVIKRIEEAETVNKSQEFKLPTVGVHIWSGILAAMVAGLLNEIIFKTLGIDSNASTFQNLFSIKSIAWKNLLYEIWIRLPLFLGLMVISAFMLIELRQSLPGFSHEERLSQHFPENGKFRFALRMLRKLGLSTKNCVLVYYGALYAITSSIAYSLIAVPWILYPTNGCPVLIDWTLKQEWGYGWYEPIWTLGNAINSFFVLCLASAVFTFVFWSGIHAVLYLFYEQTQEAMKVGQ